jgi:hypothetical protein
MLLLLKWDTFKTKAMNLSLKKENNQRLIISKFESMLKTNCFIFFDSEFEKIILHYMWIQEG